MKDFWPFYGKAAFVFSVLWFFGLLFNVMMLALLIGGLALVFAGAYRRFGVQHDKGSKAERYLQNVLGEKRMVQVTKNDKMDHELQELHEVFRGGE